jgi:hypothetical protein
VCFSKYLENVLGLAEMKTRGSPSNLNAKKEIQGSQVLE